MMCFPLKKAGIALWMIPERIIFIRQRCSI